MYGYQFYNMQLAARDNGWAQFVAMENHYNLLYREDERELIPICRQMNVALMPYSPLAAGHLTRPEWNSDSIRSRTDRAAMGKYDRTQEQDMEIVRRVYLLAEKYGVGIDIHLHDSDTLGAFEIHRIMDAMEARQYQAPVTISHAFAIAGIQGTDRDELVERMAKNKVTLTTTVAMGDSPITLPIDYLVRKGVQVELGHDSLIDHWSPFGTGDTIQKLNQVVRRFSWGDERRIGQVLKFASGGITPLSKKGEQLWPKVGDVANAILVDAVSSAHLIARQCPISIVISNGRIIHQADIKLKGAYRG